ncbi:kinase-like domain-containing protein [Hyaloraphidium curvatum]|nr:kinase-like domain-containing protein [Hyaloraphidium curvatum]
MQFAEQPRASPPPRAASSYLIAEEPVPRRERRPSYQGHAVFAPSPLLGPLPAPSPLLGPAPAPSRAQYVSSDPSPLGVQPAPPAHAGLALPQPAHSRRLSAVPPAPSFSDATPRPPSPPRLHGYPVDPTPEQLADLVRHGRARRRQFKDLRVLGRGTEGTVKLAVSLDTGGLVALKAVPRPQGPGARELERHIRRRMLAVVDHAGPSLVASYDVFETEHKFYAAMEYCPGGDLGNYVAAHGGKLPERDARRVATMILRTLAYLHANGITHRDMKPGNLLLKRENDLDSLCLADFGQAFIDGTVQKSAMATMRQMKTLTGTPFYLAPEVIEGGTYTSKVDLWSAGCILFELLFGSTPFHASASFAELFDRIARAAYHIPPDHGCTEQAVDLVRRLLDPDPERRPSAAQALGHPWLAADRPQLPRSSTMPRKKAGGLMGLFRRDPSAKPEPAHGELPASLPRAASSEHRASTPQPPPVARQSSGRFASFDRPKDRASSGTRVEVRSDGGLVPVMQNDSGVSLEELVDAYGGWSIKATGGR